VYAVFTHFYYIPIILAAIWWRKKGLIVAFLLAGFLLFSHLLHGSLLMTWHNFFRIGMFFILAYLVAILIEKLIGAEKAYEKTQAELNHVFDQASDGVCIIDKNYTILRANRKLSTFFHFGEKPIFRQKCYELLSCSKCHTPECMLTRILAGEEKVEYDIEYAKEKRQQNNKAAQVRLQYSITGAPLRSSCGEFIGVVENIRDITERKKIQEAVRLSEAALRKQKTVLEKKNIALHEVLSHIEREKEQIKKNMKVNMEKLVLPSLQKLRVYLNGSDANAYIDLVEQNLQEVTSSFGFTLAGENTPLTQKEIEICAMIKSGLTSKDIANLLTISPSTIETHRNNIRKKLGLRNKDINLSTYLQTQ